MNLRLYVKLLKISLKSSKKIQKLKENFKNLNMLCNTILYDSLVTVLNISGCSQ